MTEISELQMPIISITMEGDYKMLNQMIKDELCAIIDATYKDESEEQKDQYKDFSFHLINRDNRYYYGKYTNCGIHLIEVYEALFNSHTIAKTSVHELAHHIANIKYGPASKHQKPFYVVLRELIYGALDAGILRIEHFTHDTSHRKVQKILREYIPCPSEGNRVRSVIEVRVGYKYKKIMTGKGYTWNNTDKIWQKPFAWDDIKTLRQTGIAAIERTGDTTERHYCVIDPEVLISPQIYIETMPDINGFPSELRERFEYRWEGVVSYLKQQHQDVDKDSWIDNELMRFTKGLLSQYGFGYDSIRNTLKLKILAKDKDFWMNSLTDLPYVRESCKFSFSKPAEHIDDAYRAVATQ